MQSSKVISPRGSANPDLDVGALIDTISRSWNNQLLAQLFFPFKQEKILSIPISNRFPEDSLCWDHERDGMYTVKSAYRALFDDEWKGNEEAPSCVCNLWKKVWLISVLPRIKIFAWRTCLEALPTIRGLSRRLPDYDGTCCIYCRRLTLAYSSFLRR